MTVKRWRTKRGLKQIEAAPMLGLSPTMLVRLESGERTASLGLALQIERRTNGEVRAEEIPLTKRSKALLRSLRAAASSGAAA